MTHTLSQLAGEAYRAFERIQRGDETIVVLKDEHRADQKDWIYELVHDAHGGLFLPDDWRYENIRAILGAIEDVPDADLDDARHEIVDGLVDVYTHARLQWLASNLNRASYVDEAVDELGGEGLDTTERIGLGQYAELDEIYSSVLESLRERLKELEDEDDEDDEEEVR